MRSFSFQHKAVLLISIVFAATTAYGQDLGSSNKLFGGKPVATPKPAAIKKAPKKRAPIKVKASVVKPKSTAKTAARKPPVAKKQAIPIKAVIAPRTTEATGAVTTGSSKGSSPAIEAQYEKLIDIGNLARDSRDYVEAESAYTKAKLLKPKDARSFIGLGNLYADQQRWEDAEKAYRSSIEIDAGQVSSLVALSFVLTRPVSAPNLSERYDEAERLARRALKTEPQNPLANDQLGELGAAEGLVPVIQHFIVLDYLHAGGEGAHFKERHHRVHSLVGQGFDQTARSQA